MMDVLRSTFPVNYDPLRKNMTETAKELTILQLIYRDISAVLDRVDSYEHEAMEDVKAFLTAAAARIEAWV